ncbi:IS1634 family transposase [Phycicoccus sp. CSK15P-2]|uniref:IS1634 family transposase n=1 Tax=Phycicoccus sp. CSK15P-2 TaxID=2807627 RepID=UPI00194FC64F|nr:IS1634 family transposase [Phycicoccus sp. CSK15P-2]MBM6402961.1 IS1634 family transposase [Phycicoccus sp. CSK15P-2]
MAFIRRVRTASGATAVQVAEYGEGRQRILAHVGSAHTEAELGVLLERARELLADPGQGVLELGVGPSPVVTALVATGEPSGLLSGGAVSASAGRDGPGRVVGTSSRVLYEALVGVYDRLGFEVALSDGVFKDLVIARVVEPTSLLDCGRVLGELGVAPASYATMKRTLTRAQERGYREKVAAACYAHASTSGDLSLVLYDVTTLYFEAEREDELRKVGYSKERRVDPQVVVGLLVDRRGFPLEVGCFEGNKAETTTLLPIIRSFQERHALESMAVVADAGMLSATNLKELDAAGVRFIVGSRAAKAPGDLASYFRWHGDAFTDGQVIDTITPRVATRAAAAVNDVRQRAEPVWDPSEHPGSWRAVWAYSAKRAARDAKTLTLQEHRAQAVIAGEKATRTPRFVKTTGGALTLDTASLTRARCLVGLKGYVTNIPATLMPADEVIGSYHDLWRVEQSFRMSKTDLRARPMFHPPPSTPCRGYPLREAIEAHLTIVVTALAVAREAQARTGLAIRNLVRQLRPLRSATIAINGAQQTFPPAIPDQQQAHLDALSQNGTHALTE